MITSQIVADSINSSGNRLTSFVLEYPRYIHSEVLTHRVFSKNAASSRAIPIEKFIQQITDNPAMPEHWGANQSGMQANQELDDINNTAFVNPNTITTPKKAAIKIWLEARDKAIEYALELNRIGLHKQITNRILEPWFHIRIILTGTEFENFFALRAHKDAHPDLQKLAYLMLEQYNKSNPKFLNEGEWHIPFGDKFDFDKLKLILKKYNDDGENFDKYNVDNPIEELKKKISVARCARISYLNYEGKDDYEADIKLCDRLFGNNPKHLSPTEHVAMALDNSDWSGNFRGFKQYRKFFNEENLNDDRVLKK